ncbi:SusC/RagA family TonB-linked outer membrane protein [Membranihabitans maritimus]|uniref:SusC/RagA family TonB-linked outer membrane protein n=1 Tax=Membranihabitans maritimus TaxID=2904244 RepID=UPI001F325FA6|nr:TonB-dependent receptor [Membranihabitans maritimus]
MILLVGGIQLLTADNVHSQDLESITITVEMKDASLEDLFQKIEQQTSLKFVYGQYIAKDQYRFSISRSVKTVKAVLDQALLGTNLIYKQINGNIVVYLNPVQRQRSNNVKVVSLLQRTNRFEPQEIIKGKIVDQSGEPLIGVNVLVKGTDKGTATDFEGNFILEDVDDNAVIVVSYIGYQTQEVPITGKSNLTITLLEDSQTLDEVVVVGYGTQKKVNLTGAVTSVSGEQLSKRTVSQTSQLLQGAASGLTVTQGSGEPGGDQASLKIRGLGTFSGAGTEPLVLVDGVPSSINSVNPNNIESISVLKDAASAAIYGARAANGVILITTKEGKKGELQISYDSYIGKQEATELPNYVDSWLYAEMINESRANEGQSIVYTQEEIEKFKSGDSPDDYPNKSHLEDLFNSGNGLQTKHNLTFRGGTEEAVYLFSAGYLKQNGLVRRNEYDRYDLQLNVNSRLKDNLNLNIKLFGYQSLNERPAGIATDGARTVDMSGVIQAANHYNASVAGKKSDGTYGIIQGHPVAEAHLDSKSFGETRNTNFNTNISLEWDILSSLKFNNRVSYQWANRKNRLFGAEFVAAPGWSFGPTQSEIGYSNSNELMYESVLHFDQSIGSHYFNVLAGFSVITNNYESIGGYRDNFPSTQLYVLDAGSTENDNNSENATTWKLVSYFGRATYNIQDKYLFEGNLRFDGSSRFEENNRYGFFPSFSAGWRLSEESFFQVPWIDDFKIRASYGILGNQQIGIYPYQKTLSLGSVYPLGVSESIFPGVQLTNLPFEGITWETTKITNGGIDIDFFKGKFSFNADYYYKRTDNILYQLSVSQVLGMSVGEQNAGEVENKGVEFELGYRHSIGDFNFKIQPNFSINQNKVLSLAGVERDIAKGLFVGESLASIYGYETDGLFLDQADIESYATQNYVAKPGFPRFKDISGPNGVPDGNINSEYDRKIIGNQFPKYNYGMGISGDFRGFDFFVQLQGLGGYQTLIQGDEQAFNNFGNIQQWHVDNRWTADNPDRNAEYPRLEASGHSAPWEVNLDYWTRDGSFLRLKNVQFGYNLLNRFLENSNIDHFRIYLHGENLFSLNNYYPGWDPEMETRGGQAVNYYPITRVWSLGINLQF